jgi:hypothetical protein
VENDLFRVHRYFFIRESVVFRDMFSLPTGSETFTEGQSDDRPIVLQDVKSADFEGLVWMFYNELVVSLAPLNILERSAHQFWTENIVTTLPLQ